MRNIIGLLARLIFHRRGGRVRDRRVELFNTDARGWTTGEPAPPNWMPWAAWRAFAWPKTYFEDADKIRPNDLPAWLMVKYEPGPGVCG